MRPDDCVPDELAHGDRDAEQRADTAGADATTAPELAHALRLVRRLDDMPLARAEIDAARLRVHARVFAEIAAQHAGTRIPAGVVWHPSTALRVEDVSTALARGSVAGSHAD